MIDVEVVDYYFGGETGGLEPSDVEQVIELADCLVDIGPDRVTRAMRALGLYNKYFEAGPGEEQGHD